MPQGPDPADSEGPRRRGPAHTRQGSAGALGLLWVLLAAAVALIVTGARGDLSKIGALDYRLALAGLLLVMFLFALYTNERERRFRDLVEELGRERAALARKSAGVDFLKNVQTERDLVSALLAASADGILLVDPNRRVERMNPALEEMTGRKLDAPGNILCEDLFGCRHEGRLACGDRCPFEGVFATGNPMFEHTFEARRNDGSHVWLSGAYGPVPTDDERRVAFAVGSLRDVTKSKEVEQLQHDFVSIVSHELRGPLTAIKGFVKTLILKEAQIPADTRNEFLQTINEQADRLDQLVDDLLNVSRIESRRLKMKFAEVDLEALMKRILEQYRMKWNDREIVVEVVSPFYPVRADASKVEEIFVNLIDNAVKYSPAGGPIRISMGNSGDRVEIAIEDSGIGISPEDAARLFEKFHRIATPETRDIGGTGLGLYIVKSLIGAHGGTVHVTSAPGVGSTFTVTLPRAGIHESD